MVAIQEMSRMTSTCLDRLCLAMLGTVAEDQELRFDWNSTLQNDPADLDQYDRFRLQNEIQRSKLDSTRGYRVSKCALAEIVLLTLHDFNRSMLKLHPYYETPVTKRRFANRCATVNVQDTTVTSRFMVRQSRRLHRMESLSSFTETVAKEAERLTSDCAPHTIAFFLQNSWVPGSAERRTTWASVDFEARTGAADGNRSFQQLFEEGWKSRIGGPPHLNSYDCCPDKPLIGSIDNTHCGDVCQEFERGLSRWIEDGRKVGHRGVGLVDYQPICSEMHLIDAIIVNKGDINVFTNKEWRRPLVVDLMFIDVLPNYLHDVKKASYPSKAGPPVAKAARSNPSAGSSGGVSTYQTPMSGLTEPPPIVPTVLQQSLASAAAVGAAEIPVPEDRQPVVPKAQSVPSSPSTTTFTTSMESNVDPHMEVTSENVSRDESLGTSLPAMAPPTTTSISEPHSEPQAEAVAMTDTAMVPPPPSHTLATDSRSTESPNRPIDAEPIEGQSAAAASPPAGTGILPPNTEVSAEAGTRLPTGAGDRTSVPPSPTGASEHGTYPSEGPLKDLLDEYGPIGEIPTEDLEICVDSLESRIAEGVRHRNTAKQRHNWQRYKTLCDRYDMFNVHLKTVTEELGRRIDHY